MSIRVTRLFDSRDDVTPHILWTVSSRRSTPLHARNRGQSMYRSIGLFFSSFPPISGMGNFEMKYDNPIENKICTRVTN